MALFPLDVRGKQDPALTQPEGSWAQKLWVKSSAAKPPQKVKIQKLCLEGMINQGQYFGLCELKQNNKLGNM